MSPFKTPGGNEYPPVEPQDPGPFANMEAPEPDPGYVEKAMLGGVLVRMEEIMRMLELELRSERSASRGMAQRWREETARRKAAEKALDDFIRIIAVSAPEGSP